MSEKSQKDSIINVDLTPASDFSDKIKSFFLNPVTMSIIIIGIAAALLVFFVVKAATPQAPAKEASTGQLDNPKVVVETFEDFQCPACRQFNSVYEQLVEKYKGQNVKFVFKQFPLRQIHSYAQQAAEASEYANDHGKFWEYKSKLYTVMEDAAQKAGTEDPSVLSVDNLIKYGVEMGFDEADMRKAMDDRTYKNRVNTEEDEGINRGVNSTPTIFVNGKEFVEDASKGVYRDLNGVSAVIDEELKK